MRRAELVKKRVLGWQFDGVKWMIDVPLDNELCGVVRLRVLVALMSLLMATLMAPSLLCLPS